MKKIATKFKLIYIMFLILGIIAIMFLYKNKELNRFNQTSFGQSTTKELEIPKGYWLSDNYSFYINEESFILMNNNNYEISYFNILGDHAEKNNIHYSVELVANKSNEVNLFEEAIDISFQQKDEYLTITFNQEEKEMIIDEQFLQITDDHVLSQLVDVVETNGIVIAEKLPELTIDDFKGYWYSFDKNNYEIYPYGTTYIYIDDEYMLSGWSGSDYITLSFNDYIIENNQLTYQADVIDMEMSLALEYDYDHERDIQINSMTLFKEENDRDRLVINSTGSVLQKVEIEELSEVQTTFGVDDQTFSLEKLSWTEELIDNFHEIYEKEQPSLEDVKIDTIVKLENYPYSLGELSKRQLYEEYQIINQKIKHPEGMEEKEKVIEQLINHNFESTPSFGLLDFVDNGYYFDESFENNVASYTYGFGGRTEWESGPGYAEISEIDFKDNIYTLTIEDSNYHDQGDVINFFRINENIIYAEDNNGNFTQRYEKDSDWDDYKGLPQRTGYYE